MALIRLANIEDLNGAAREVAESGREQYGTVLETWKALMNMPDMFATYLPFLRQVAGPGPLDAALKDACALYVGYLNHCLYTTSHRATSAGKKGISPDQMRLVVSGDWSSLPEDWRVALALTRELTLNTTTLTHREMPQGANPQTLAAVKAHFSDEEILDLVMTITTWNALARFHRVMDFESDMPDAPEGVNPQ